MATTAEKKPSSNRPDNKYQRNETQVTVTKAQSSSPSYRLQLLRQGGGTPSDTSGRFAIFRDLFQLLNADGRCDAMKNKFPPTLAKSSIGMPMTPAEVEARRAALDGWFRELFDNFNDFPPVSRSTLSKFVSLPESDIELVDVPPVVEEKAVPEGERRTASMKGVSTVLLAVKKFSKAVGKDIPRSATAAQSVPAAPGYLMTVYVSRGSTMGNHQTYELNVKYHPQERRLIVSKEFKEYRSLMHTLAAHGVRHAAYDERDKDHEEEAVEAAEFTRVIDVPNPFPRTYNRSSIGVPLTEEALSTRCIMLDKWMKDILFLFHSFDPPTKGLVNKFLGCSEEYENDVVEHVVELLNVPGSVVGNPPVPATEGGGGEAKFEDRPTTTYMKAVRRDTLQQPSSVVITFAPVNGHPLYTMSIVRQGQALSEVKGQFAKFRDLHGRLNADKYCDTLLTAPFPATKRRSSIGLKLTDDLLEVRRQELNTVCSRVFYSHMMHAYLPFSMHYNHLPSFLFASGGST
jgi:hypothetical protein